MNKENTRRSSSSSSSTSTPTSTSPSAPKSPVSSGRGAMVSVAAATATPTRQTQQQRVDEGELYVLFKIDKADYALAVDVVMQMETYTGATIVPGAPPFVVGIIQLRGRVVPVVDLRVRFGLPPRATTLETRVVVGEIHDRAVALVVDSAREVARMTRAQLIPPPRLIEDGAKGFVKAVAQLGERTVMVLDFAKVIGEEALDVV